MKRPITILVIVAMVLLLTACATTKRSNEAVEGASSRMVVVEDAVPYSIVFDKETRVMYAVSTGLFNRGNFTLLVDANGNPLLYKN